MGGENEEENLRMFCLCVTRTDGEVLGSGGGRGEKVVGKDLSHWLVLLLDVAKAEKCFQNSIEQHQRASVRMYIASQRTPEKSAEKKDNSRIAF